MYTIIVSYLKDCNSLPKTRYIYDSASSKSILCKEYFDNYYEFYFYYDYYFPRMNNNRIFLLSIKRLL